MEVDGEGSRSLLAPSGTPVSVSVALHPLLLMNISDHWTRSRAQASGVPQQVLGAVLGRQSGRSLELTNSFELPFSRDGAGGAPVLDAEFARTREAQYKEVFPDLDLLGWYTTGEAAPTAADVAVQAQMAELAETPVFLKMSPGAAASEQLPVGVFESVVDVRDGAGLFLPAPFTLATEEAERIGVDHVARISATASAPSSAASKTLSNQLGAVKMLGDRLAILLRWVTSVQKGEVEMDHEVMRDIAALTHRLPIFSSTEFHTEFHNQCNDITLTTYLGSMTKTYGVLNQLVTKLNVMHERHGPSSFRRTRGMPI